MIIIYNLLESRVTNCLAQLICVLFCYYSGLTKIQLQNQIIYISVFAFTPQYNI